MIISRAPFRVSFAGGGSDIPSFYEKYGGCVLSTTIRRYMYVILQKSFMRDGITLKYSKTEIVKDPSQIEHKIFRQVLSDLDVRGMEITSVADIPAGTGLGSSSAFTVALLRGLYTMFSKPKSAYKIAEMACDVEINRLGNPIGKQDQFASSFGGLRYYELCPDGFVKVEPIVMKRSAKERLGQNLLMFYTGEVHDANKILANQSKSYVSDTDKIEATKKLVLLTKELKEQLEANNIDFMGEALRRGWQIKKELAAGISDPLIDKIYETGIRAGATGGKLLGAGGGGFLLFYVPDAESKASVIEALKDRYNLPFEWDNAGCSVVFYE